MLVLQDQLELWKYGSSAGQKTRDIESETTINSEARKIVFLCLLASLGRH